MDKSNMIHTITTLKLLARDRRLKEEQVEATVAAIACIRELETEMDLKNNLIESLGKMYILNAKTEYGEGWNSAIRGILDLLDPTQQRYKGAST